MLCPACQGGGERLLFDVAEHERTYGYKEQAGEGRSHRRGHHPALTERAHKREYNPEAEGDGNAYGYAVGDAARLPPLSAKGIPTSTIMTFTSGKVIFP